MNDFIYQSITTQHKLSLIYTGGSNNGTTPTVVLQIQFFSKLVIP